MFRKNYFLFHIIIVLQSVAITNRNESKKMSFDSKSMCAKKGQYRERFFWYLETEFMSNQNKKKTKFGAKYLAKKRKTQRSKEPSQICRARTKKIAQQKARTILFDFHLNKFLYCLRE